MMRVSGLIDEERRGPIYIESNKIELAVVVDISECDTPPRLQWPQIQPCLICDIVESMPFDVSKEL